VSDSKSNNRITMAVTSPANIHDDCLLQGLLVKNTFLHFAKVTEGDFGEEDISLTKLEKPWKRQASEPAPSRMYSGAMRPYGYAGCLEVRGDTEETCSTIASSERHEEDSSQCDTLPRDEDLSQCDTPQRDEDLSQCDTLHRDEGLSQSDTPQGDEDLSQCDTPQRQTSEEVTEISVVDESIWCQPSTMSGKSVCRQLSEEAWPTWRAPCDQDTFCWQMTDQTWPTWGYPSDPASQMAMMPTMMVPMFQPTNHKFGPSASNCGSDVQKKKTETMLNSFPLKGSKRREWSLITMAQKQQERERQQKQIAPALTQMQLRQLREQLDERRAELVESVPQNDAVEKPSNRQHVAFCPYCGGGFKPGFKFCGYCGQDVSKILPNLKK
jgi:hypothetical protein